MFAYFCCRISIKNQTMRKLKLQVQVSIDGYMSGINAEMDWLTMPWSQDLNTYVSELTYPVDTILLGKNLAMGFIPYWTEANNSSEPIEGAKKFVETHKVVFSKILSESIWENTVVNNGELTSEITELKKQTGGDIIVYGGCQFVASLIQEKLIDEIYLFVNPTAIGKGISVFHTLNAKQNFSLIHVQNFECGITVLAYKPLP